jgi:uncharacterized RDD family membrane protein YckC
MTALLAILFLEGAGTVAIVFAILASIFWLWMLIDCLMNPRLQGTEKIVWVLVVLFLHLLGAVIYFVIGRQRTGVP